MLVQKMNLIQSCVVTELAIILIANTLCDSPDICGLKI